MMAAFETSRPAPFGAIIVYRAVSLLGNAYDALRNWNSKRATLKALRRLGAHELNDIGLTLADVEAMAHRGVNRR